ncbi:MAG: hypothetical protein ACMVP2_00725 [Imperialibacter sp.]|uniref:hypothetical protein n=1 Tax=Imperialibacter sp. TaxID=2038411 RepID=UPI003A84EBDE
MASLNKRVIGIVLTVTLLLIGPLVAMQFTDEVKWGPFDFVIAAILLIVTGFLVEFVMRRVKKVGKRTVLIFSILMGLILLWAEIAVGIFGSPIAGS